MLSVKDDGAGIAQDVLGAGSRPGHWGLPGMRERAAQLDGTLDIASAPGQGTELTLRIPAASAYC
ncbi:Sensor histidine kinase LiaS [compost metagenome]